MCGIFGFQVTPGHEISLYESTLISLVLAGEMEKRGRDSYGCVQIPMVDDEDKVAHILRGTGKVSENGGQLFTMAAHSKAFLAHTRAATQGSICIDNCHPFRQGDVLGVHNGIIVNHNDLNTLYNRDFAVDSMHAFAHIDADLPLTELDGYGTFFWTRSSENWSKLYYARTKEGSLSVAKLYRDPHASLSDPDHFITIWASEWAALQRVSHLLHTGYHSVLVDTEVVYSLSEGEITKTNEPFKLTAPVWEKKKSSGRSGAWNNNRNTNDKHVIIFPHNDADDVDEGANLSWKHKQLTRRQRKALKKIERKAREKANTHSPSDRSWSKDPLVENIVSGMGLEKVYIPINGRNGDAKAHYLCPECACPLSTHIWGWCQNNSKDHTSCKAIKGLGCMSDSYSLPVCNDCGHYLVEGVHEEASTRIYSIVECNECGNYCAPESMILNKAREEEKKQEKEIAEEDKLLTMIQQVDRLLLEAPKDNLL